MRIEGLLCIVAIAILFVVRKFLFIPKIDKDQDPTREIVSDSED